MTAEAWVTAAMERWKPLETRVPMDSLGVDVARGGKDQTIIAPRHGNWFGELIRYPGTETPNGPMVAGLVIQERRDAAPVHIDIIGVGSSPYDFLVQNGVQAIPVNVSKAARKGKVPETTREGEVAFFNTRSMIIWRMREALDPANGELIALPPDEDLKKELCMAKWSFGKTGIRVEAKEEIVKRLQHSPDLADAVCLANMDTPKASLTGKKIDYAGWG